METAGEGVHRADLISCKGSLHSIFFQFQDSRTHGRPLLVVLCCCLFCLLPSKISGQIGPNVDRPTPPFPPSGPNWFPSPSLAPCIWRLCFLNVSQWRENNAINLLKGKKHVNALAGTKKVQDLKYCSLHCFLGSLPLTVLLEQLIHEQPLQLWGLMLLWLFYLLDEV